METFGLEQYLAHYRGARRRHDSRDEYSLYSAETNLIVSSTAARMKLSVPILRISNGSSSNPTVNRSSTIPREASRFIVPRSCISPRPKGPIIIPAMSWPSTTGCFIFEKRKLKPNAAEIASPRFSRRENSGVAAKEQPVYRDRVDLESSALPV